MPAEDNNELRLTVSGDPAGIEMQFEVFLKRCACIVKDWCSAILLSGGDHDCSQYSIAAWNPLVTITYRNWATEIITSEGTERPQGDLFSILDDLYDRFSIPDLDFPVPFQGGAVGYLGYELKNSIEKLPQTARDDLGLPEMFFFIPSDLLIYDHARGSTYEIKIIIDGLSPLKCEETAIHKQNHKSLNPSSSFTEDEYLKAVKRIRRYIKDGDVYQVNLSQRFTASPNIEPFDLFTRLYCLNPAPFYAFINCGEYQIISTSMERFVRRYGSHIETRPIKGTRPRGSTREKDLTLKQELLNSQKDEAELSMIVDLLRNDLGKICLPGTVAVREHKRIERYQNVFHLVSVITGELHESVRHGEVIRALFPGGSITGCPKIRAMEIIDELEPCVRHVYTGSIGYLGLDGSMDLNIAIRTALYHKGLLHFSAGGGIVYDSKPLDEYLETLHKARSFISVLKDIGSIPHGMHP